MESSRNLLDSGAAREFRSNPKSSAQIAGHPLHPMIIPFPVAFFVATLACNIAFWWTGNESWPTASLWLLGAGLIMAALAAALGLIDFLGEPRIRALRDAWWHMVGNVAVVLLELVNWYRRYDSGDAAVIPWGWRFHLLSSPFFCSPAGRDGTSSTAIGSGYRSMRSPRRRGHARKEARAAALTPLLSTRENRWRLKSWTFFLAANRKTRSAR